MGLLSDKKESPSKYLQKFAWHYLDWQAIIMSLVNIRKAAGLGIGLFSVSVILSEVKDLFERKCNFLRFLFPA